MLRSRLTRRRFLATTAASTALIAMPHVSHSQAGGKLTMGFWDHWVPGANNASKTLCEEWGTKNKVEVQIDSITSQGHKNLLTIAAEQQARPSCQLRRSVKNRNGAMPNARPSNEDDVQKSRCS